jgi:hypothetical protein
MPLPAWLSEALWRRRCCALASAPAGHAAAAAAVAPPPAERRLHLVPQSPRPWVFVRGSLPSSILKNLASGTIMFLSQQERGILVLESKLTNSARFLRSAASFTGNVHTNIIAAARPVASSF